MEINTVNTTYVTNKNLIAIQAELEEVEGNSSLIDSSGGVDEVIISGANVSLGTDINVIPVTPGIHEVSATAPTAFSQNIKEMLYKIHHPAEGFANGETNNGKIGDAWDILQHARNALNDTSINVNTGLSKAQLLQLTQRDSWEASNTYFFGNINLVFDKIAGDDGNLSFEELDNFTGYQLGTNNSNTGTFATKVNSYANSIDSEYQKLSNAKKLSFAIDKAEEYLDAMGYEEQLNALRRLNQTSGKIAFADCDGALGYYRYGQVDGIFVDDSDADCGIRLDTSYFITKKAPWYELVSTLVHELTHATAYLYGGRDTTNDFYLIYDNKAYPSFTDEAIEKMYEVGYITSSQKNSYISQIKNKTLPYADYQKLSEYQRTFWGEYAAYQTNEDYLDSVARSDFGDGAVEKTKIKNHITANYTNEIVPSNDWWITYGKIGYNA